MTKKEVTETHHYHLQPSKGQLFGLSHSGHKLVDGARICINIYD